MAKIERKTVAIKAKVMRLKRKLSRTDGGPLLAPISFIIYNIFLHMRSIGFAAEPGAPIGRFLRNERAHSFEIPALHGN